jgi:acetyltransferase-like isoleucine patch superfamily enzyme
VNIGNRVWVGSHVKILKGVRIADDCVIGMGTIVTNDVPANSLSVGSPNKTIRANISWTLES